MAAGVRPPAVAGSFYPGERDALATTVDGLLDTVAAEIRRAPSAVIVPHAGYAYSGRIAAAAYGGLRPFVDGIGTVAILGPAHFAMLDGCATAAPATLWRTPLGDVRVDERVRRVAMATGLVVVDDTAHAGEHALEVQLPFLQRLLGGRMRFTPIAVGDASPGEVAMVIEAIEPVSDLVVVSTDLSHYEDAETARLHDDRTIAAIVARDPEAIGPRDACGRFALRGAVTFARRHGRDVRLLAAATSADAGGDTDRVVGYASFTIAGGPGS